MTEHEPEPGKVIQLRPPAELDKVDYLEGKVVDHDDEQLPHPVVAHSGYVIAGAAVVVRRVWETRSTFIYDQAIRAAEAVGDHEHALEWEARRAAFVNDRHNRRFDWIELPAKILRILPWLGAAILAGLLILGILLALATKDPHQIIAPIMWAAAFAHFTVITIRVLWFPMLLAGAVTVAVLLWLVGRNSVEDRDLDWMATSTEDDDLEIDEMTITRAIDNLQIPQISKYLKQGLPLQYLTPARVDGRGTHAVIRLPSVSAERVVKRRPDLAAGLHRAAKEVWPKTGTEAGILDIWIADKGALEEGAGPYPLLEDGFTDWFKGVPYGKTLRGTPLVAPMEGRNTIVGGMPDQGKSSGARVIATGAQLDITVELRIWVPDSNYDFEVFRRRCSRYVMGAEPEKIEQILHDLRELYDEIQTRGDLLVKYQEPEVTRKLASAGIGLHPILGLVEEAHVAMNNAQHGEEIRFLVGQIVMLGRKRAIHLILSTQAPTKDSMPKEVTRNCSNGIAFAVGDHYANDAILGQGAHRGGHRATELIPGTDAGTALVKGFTGQRSEMVQAYFLSVRGGNDQVTPLIDRALAEIERRGLAVPGTDRARRELETRELLDDVDEVLGAERITVADLATLLRQHAPQWQGYRNLTGTELKASIEEQLQGTGVQCITRTNGVIRIDPSDFRKALSVLSTLDLDEE